MESGRRRCSGKSFRRRMGTGDSWLGKRNIVCKIGNR